MTRIPSENRHLSDNNIMPVIVGFLASFIGTGIGLALFILVQELRSIEGLINAAQ